MWKYRWPKSKSLNSNAWRKTDKIKRTLISNRGVHQSYFDKNRTTKIILIVVIFPWLSRILTKRMNHSTSTPNKFKVLTNHILIKIVRQKFFSLFRDYQEFLQREWIIQHQPPISSKFLWCHKKSTHPIAEFSCFFDKVPSAKKSNQQKEALMVVIWCFSTSLVGIWISFLLKTINNATSSDFEPIVSTDEFHIFCWWEC